MLFTRINKATAVILMLTLGSFQSAVVSGVMAQTPAKAGVSRVTGELSVRGVVMLNGARVSNGATVLTSGKIQTGDNSSAMVNLGRLGQVELAAGSEIILSVDGASIGGALKSGRAVFSAPAGVKVNVATMESKATTDGMGASVVTVDAACGQTQISAAKSAVMVTSPSKTETVPAGGTTQVGSSAPNCKRMAIATAPKAIGAAGFGLLALAGIGGVVAGIVAVTKSNGSGVSALSNISNFKP